MLGDDINIDVELKRIDDYLDQLGETSPEKNMKAASFITTNLINGEDAPPISYKLAANYLKWVLGRGTPKEEFLQSCKCSDGWVEKEDATVYPCDRCRSDDLWWKENVDEDWGPSV